MSEQMSLGGILDGSKPPEVSRETPSAEPAAPEPIPAVSVEAVPERARGADGKFVAKEAAPEVPVAAAPVVPVTPAQQEMTPQHRAAIAQANDERHKRQALEARLAALEAAKPKEPPKAFWDDPEGALKTFEQKIDGVVVNTRLNTAEAIARSKYPDFEEKVAAFKEVLDRTPGLHVEWLASPDPAEFAYKTGKNQMDFRQLGSMGRRAGGIRGNPLSRSRV